MNENELLKFINTSSAEAIDQLGEENGNSIGAETAHKIVAYRNELEHGQFDSIEELSRVKGLGTIKIAKLLRSIDLVPKVQFTQSNTYINFWGDPQPIKHWSKHYFLKKIRSFKAEEKGSRALNIYELHYDRTKVDKNALLQSFQAQGGFGSPVTASLVPYALQAENNKFLSVNSAGDVTFKDTITNDEIFTFFFGMSVPGWPYSGRVGADNNHIYQPLGSASFEISKLDGNKLYYDYSNDKLSYDRTNSVFSSNPPNFPFGFEAFYRSNAFSFINYYSHTIPANDPRKFIAQEGLEAKGSNDVDWYPRNFYRPLRVFQNISLKSEYFSNSLYQHLVSVDANGSVHSNAITTSSNIPDASKFDLFVYDGAQWSLDQDVPHTPRVLFRSKANGRYLSVDDNGYLNCLSQGISHNETFALERMWGVDNTNSAIKTHLGKYIHTYNGQVLPDAINKVMFEAYKILEP